MSKTEEQKVLCRALFSNHVRNCLHHRVPVAQHGPQLPKRPPSQPIPGFIHHISKTHVRCVPTSWAKDLPEQGRYSAATHAAKVLKGIRFAVSAFHFVL
eukprot:4112419-Amphidinium_carterae.1